MDDNSNLAKEIAHYEERWGEYNHLGRGRDTGNCE